MRWPLLAGMVFHGNLPNREFWPIARRMVEQLWKYDIKTGRLQRSDHLRARRRAVRRRSRSAGGEQGGYYRAEWRADARVQAGWHGGASRVAGLSSSPTTCRSTQTASAEVDRARRLRSSPTTARMCHGQSRRGASYASGSACVRRWSANHGGLRWRGAQRRAEPARHG